MGLPLETRKYILESLIKDQPIFRFSDSFNNGPALYREAMNRNLEGIVAFARIYPL
jgi:bifunctional non-homologous end joining protein LigD